MLRFTGEKMSKSVGNIATLREALDEWGRETLLLFFLGGHWRKPIDFSEETMEQAAAQRRDVPERVSRAAGRGRRGELGSEFVDALEDDFDTPRALAIAARVGIRAASGLARRALEVFGLGSLAERAGGAAGDRRPGGGAGRGARDA